eukprot:IDg20613t1
MYSHFHMVHPDIYNILDPLVKARMHNKRARTDTGRQVTIKKVVARSRQRFFDDALLKLFASPDISKK